VLLVVGDLHVTRVNSDVSEAPRHVNCEVQKQEGVEAEPVNERVRGEERWRDRESKISILRETHHEETTT
jgi:hypothetical protein